MFFTTVVVIVVETWRLGPTRRVFLASANTLSGLVRTESGGYDSSQCYSVRAPLQPMFNNLRLLSATRAFTVVIDASLEEGVVTSS